MIQLITDNRVGTAPGSITMQLGDPGFLPMPTMFGQTAPATEAVTSALILAQLDVSRRQEKWQKWAVVLQGLATVSIVTLAVVAVTAAVTGQRR